MDLAIIDTDIEFINNLKNELGQNSITLTVFSSPEDFYETSVGQYNFLIMDYNIALNNGYIKDNSVFSILQILGTKIHYTVDSDSIPELSSAPDLIIKNEAGINFISEQLILA